MNGIRTILCSALIPLAVPAHAGVFFDCGSDGSDGALSFAASPTPVTVDFDPGALAIDVDGDGIYHFTTVTIPANVTVRMRSVLSGWQPIRWLCTGDVDIQGTLNLDGNTGHPGEASLTHSPSIPGPGGYPGGVGTSQHQSSQTGFGPDGGTANSGSGRHQTYGNSYLQPLTGGSGGGGGVGIGQSGGGAGAGAILIASNTSVVIAGGGILARGGSPGTGPGGGWGAGGSIRVVASSISGSAPVNTTSSAGSISYGRVRFESFTDTYSGTITAREIRRVTLLQETWQPPVSGSFPKVRVTTVDGVAVPSTPLGDFTVPDVVIDESNPVTVAIEASQIPLGTTVTVFLYSENEGVGSVTSTALAGTLESSTATATATFPQGFTRGFPYATW